MPDNKDLPESRRAQLAQLNERVRSQMATLWQMPFAYVGIVALAMGPMVDRPRLLLPASILVAIAGALVLWAMAGWLESAHEAVDAISRLEGALGLELTAKKRPWTHALPHFLLVVLTIGAAVLLAIRCLPGA